MRKTAAQADPRVVGGRYLSAYWLHEYMVDAIDVVHGVKWFTVTWIPSEDALHPRASDQWRGAGYERGRHCTGWDRRDVIVSQPA